MGCPTVFIRLTGCPLRCTYCDTAYAFHGGKRWTMDAIMAQVQSYSTQYVTVTGGEPLAQAGCIHLLSTLCDAGYRVSLETSGALPVSSVDPRVIKVMDVKTPSSNEHDKQLWDNFVDCTAQDEIKFVIGNREDYDYAVKIINQYHLTDRFMVWLSPSYGQCDLAVLTQWVLDDQLAVRVQCQLHKIIWGDAQGR